jgi:large subunit ribosomal protein L33
MAERIRISLSCSVCKTRNYETTKVRREGAGPLELKKFCKTCNRHTLHVEGK